MIGLLARLLERGYRQPTLLRATDWVSSILLLIGLVVLSVFMALPPTYAHLRPRVFEINAESDGTIRRVGYHEADHIVARGFEATEQDVENDGWRWYATRYVSLTYHIFPEQLPSGISASDVEQLIHASMTLGTPDKINGRLATRPPRRFLLRETCEPLLIPIRKPLAPLGVIIVGVAGFTFVDVRRRRKIRLRHCCPRCRYSLRGLPEDTAVCPECGKAIERSAAEPTG